MKQNKARANARRTSPARNPLAANDNFLLSSVSAAFKSFGHAVTVFKEITGGVLPKRHNVGSVAPLTAANDNVRKTRTKLKGSTVAVYMRDKTACAVFRLCPKAAASVGLKDRDIVTVEPIGDAYLIRQAKKGVLIQSEGSALRIRKNGILAPRCGAKSVHLARVVEGVMVTPAGTEPSSSPPVVFDPEDGLGSFQTLGGKAGTNRLKLLAANDNDAQNMATTAAGDGCYTPWFLVMAILKAACRKMFDADFCAMREDGRYDLDLPTEVIQTGVWDSPNGSGEKLRVIGHIPAKKYYTKKAGKYGSLLLPWNVALGWLNPPYTRRLWAVFLEKAAKEVAAGRAGIIVALVPKDDTGEHIAQMFDENAYRIELSRQIPFFKKNKAKKGKGNESSVPARNIVETIRGNQLVVFGKGPKTRDFLIRLVDGLLRIGLITEKQAGRYKEQYAWSPRLNSAAAPQETVGVFEDPAPDGHDPEPCQDKPRKTDVTSKTGIDWATETVNPLKGCTKVSAECRNCYALNWAARHQGKGSRGYAGTVKDGKFTGVIGVVDDEIDRLAKVRSDRVFVNSMSDTFHANVQDETVRAMFDAMTRNPSTANFLVCTKRPDRMAKFSRKFRIPAKVWCGTTVGCAKSLSRLDDLRRVKAAVRWVSIEPLLEAIDIEPWLADGTLNWVVVAGESGPRHRPMDPAWAEAILRTCQKHDVPFFLKQWSAWVPKKDVEYPPTIDGQIWHEYPSAHC